MNLAQIKQMTTRYLFITVSIVGCLSMLTILQNPNSANSAGSPSPLLAKDRSPASLDGAIQHRSVDYPVRVVEWDCHKNILHLNSTTQIRLRLHPCQITETESLSTEVTNRTTGLAATVFKAAERTEMTTDFIALVAGENLIHIEHVLKNGHRTARDLSIVTN